MHCLLNMNKSQNQAPVVQTLDSAIHRINNKETNCTIHWIEIYPVGSAIHRINHYPADSVIDFRNIYPLDSDLFGG